MRAFLALILNMGIIQLPEIEDYWKTSWTSEIPFYGRVMSRDRFEQIFWMLHVSHSTTPAQNVAVDETMVGFRGRFGARQYMPQKPTKWGIKAFTTADSTNGYMLNILVYTGAETLRNSATQESLPQPAQIVMHLVEPYIHKGHHVFAEWYYTSIPLLQALHSSGTSFTGTDNEVLSFRSDQLLCLAWRAPMSLCSVSPMPNW